MRKAKAAAIIYRDEYMADVPSRLIQVSHRQNRNNKTGVVGVCLIWRDEVCYAQASLKTNDGKRKTKNYNIDKYGEAEAIRLAKNWRQAQLRKRKNEIRDSF